MANKKNGGSAIGKLGILLLIMGVGAQALAFIFLLEGGLKIGKMDFGDDEIIFGWYLQGLAIMLGVLALIISLKMKE